MRLRYASGLILVAALGFADTLTMKDGRTVTGTYAGGTTREVKMVVGDRVETYSIDQVSNITFGTASATQTYRYENATAAPVTPPPPPPAPARDDYATRTTTAPSGMEVPAGTTLVLRMIDNVDSQRDSVGQTYRASIDEPVVVNGQTVIPRGADATVKLVNDVQSGKIEGRTVLTLDVMQVQVNGRMIGIDTAEVTQASASRTSRSAKVIGGTAALGTIIGAIAGGGKGAAVGALSGAAVGTGAQVLTHGQRVQIPTETRLTFTLQQPLQV